MILTDFLPAKPDLSWKLAQQIGVTHAVCKCAPDLTGLPPPWKMDTLRTIQQRFTEGGFTLLGLSYGQAAGAVTANFKQQYRYTGAALTSDLAWLVGAAFAPLVALGLSAHFGLGYVSLYLLSGAVGSLAALSLNRALEIRD